MLALIPGPLPDFIPYGCEINSGSGLGTRLFKCSVCISEAFVSSMKVQRSFCNLLLFTFSLGHWSMILGSMGCFFMMIPSFPLMFQCGTTWMKFPKATRIALWCTWCTNQYRYPSRKKKRGMHFRGKALGLKHEPSSLLHYCTHTYTLIVLPQSVWTSVGLAKCSETCFAEDMVFDISLTMAFNMKVLCPKSVVSQYYFTCRVSS